MEGKKIAYISAADSYADDVAKLYYNTDSTDEFVEKLRERYPDAMLEHPETEGIPDYEIEAETDRYVVVYSDGMDECLIIYEKVKSDKCKK